MGHRYGESGYGGTGLSVPRVHSQVVARAFRSRGGALDAHHLRRFRKCQELSRVGASAGCRWFFGGRCVTKARVCRNYCVALVQQAVIS